LATFPTPHADALYAQVTERKRPGARENMCMGNCGLAFWNKENPIMYIVYI